ncbi:MAG: hypothetical protein ACRYE7_00120 [Janthinobacterium lividum]
MANGGNDVKEKVLYHVTSESNALESLKSGLDWRRTKRAKFGCGVSFSNDVDYANYHANRSTNKGMSDKMFIISLCLFVDEILKHLAQHPT